MTLAEAHDFVLPITSEAVLCEFVEVAWGVRVPNVQVCPTHSTPWRAFCDAYFGRSPVCVWHGSRGFAGKSFTLALLGLTEAVTLKSDVNILGGSGAQSKRVLEHMDNFWKAESAPRALLVSDAATTTRLTNGAKIEALMASQASVRGGHPQRLRLDEIDEMDIAILEAAQGQPMERDGVTAQTVMSSTRQYTDGTMQYILRRAYENNWPVHEWCFREALQPHGWLTQAQVDQKRGEVTAAMWLAEYENQEPSPESRAIQPAAVAKMFDESLGEFEGAAHEYIEIEPPQTGAKYVTGADWARKQDWTIIDTLRTDVTPVKRVAWERTGRLDWPVMIAKYEERLRRFPGRGIHDGTGIGDVVAGYLTEPATGIMMVGRDRANLLTEYIAAIEHGEIVSPYIRFCADEHRYASHEDVFSSGDGHHLPDSISAGALAWRGATSAPTWYML